MTEPLAYLKGQFIPASQATLPITKINGVPIGDGRPGPVCRRLLEAWSSKVGLGIVAQITSDAP